MATKTLEQTRLRRTVLESHRLASTAARLRHDCARTCGRAQKLRSALPPPAGRDGTWIYDLTGSNGAAPIRHIFAALHGGVESPGRARRLLAEHVGRRVPQRVLSQLELLVTELVTNAIVHGGGATERDPVNLYVHARDGCVRVQVSDRGDGFDPTAPRRTPGPDGGWGLLMVGQLSDAWGADHRDGRATVWFRMRF